MFNPIKELVTPRHPVIGILFFIIFIIIELMAPHVGFVYSGKIGALMFCGGFIFFALFFRHMCLSRIDNNPDVQKYGYHPLTRILRKEFEAKAENAKKLRYWE